eukprot:gnl/MRDRNA2_/MRDRNA2_80839_c0_seq6.p1 gnl/MRDRNA2_/MRDRNA2_80839_c0~~gnl/MRDRNA2_/MRDRNA2_80839_c0_seq6.p1  ORF type:complete len:1087 (+),score=144.90 gnl/MRDRNA2_/MRDRNA2_80839_c0_seq6:167-3262(+)
MTVPLSAILEVAGVLVGLKRIFEDDSEFYVMEKESTKHPHHSLTISNAPESADESEKAISRALSIRSDNDGRSSTPPGPGPKSSQPRDSSTHRMVKSEERSQGWQASEAGDVRIPGEREERGERTMHGLLQIAVDTGPAKDAVVTDSRSWTYAEVMTHVEDALLLLCPRVQAGDRVVLIIERSLQLLVHQFALWKLGCTLTCPSLKEGLDRTLVMCKDFQPHLILVQQGDRLRSLQETLGDVVDVQLAGVGGKTDVSKRAKITPVPASHPAIVFYTSGSSGVPKGVICSHQHVVRIAENCDREVDLSCRVLCRSQPQWMAFVWDAWAPILFGGTVCMVPSADEKDPEYLANFIARHSINIIIMIPSFLEKLLTQMRDYGEELYSDLRGVICIGEPCPCSVAEHFNRFFTSAFLVNYYGLTETLCTRWQVPKSLHLPAAAMIHGNLPVGMPEAGASVLLLNEHGQETDDGEIYFGGHISDGYFNDHPENNRFVIRQGERLYCTGDLGKWVVLDGEKVLLVTGRCDRQVKIRGMRVELGEVENAIRQCQGGHAVVIKDKEELAAFVEAPEGSEEKLYEHCSRALPAHMRPSRILCMTQLPRLTSSEKVDVASLKKSLDVMSHGREVVPPLNAASLNADNVLQSEAGKQLLERGVDSLGLMRTFTRMQRAEARVLNQAYALCMWGIILSHWKLHEIGSSKLHIPAYGVALMDIVMQEHCLVVFCLAGGYIQSRESNFGFMKSLVLYAIFIAWWRPLPQVIQFLSQGGTELAEESELHKTWYLTPRWFLIAMVLARTATSTMQLARIPAWMQTGLSLSILLGACYIFPANTWIPTPDAVFVLVGDVPCVKMPLVLFLHVASFHYLRRAVGQLKLSEITIDMKLALVLGFILLCSIGASNRMGIPSNMEQQSGLPPDQGTPIGVGWLILELSTSVTSSIVILASCAYAPCFILEWLGQGTAVAYVLHSFFARPATSLCKMLLLWINDSCGVFSGILSSATVLLLPVAFMAFSGLVFDLLIRIVRGFQLSRLPLHLD